MKPRVIVITGASAGMGKDMALTLCQKGYIVYGLSRRLEKMQDIIKAGGHAVQMDITEEKQIDTAITQIIQEQGKIDILINNAGYVEAGAVEDVPIEDARKQFEVNLFGLANITKAVLPYMRNNELNINKSRGTIINMSSMGGKMYSLLGAWYHASKHALEGWSDCLRIELKSHDINVIIIEPGVINTEISSLVVEPLLKNSKDGAYESMANQFADAIHAHYGNPKLSSPPSVITNLVIKAIETKYPKTRYSGGKLAKKMILMRWIMSDKQFDKMLHGS